MREQDFLDRIQDDPFDHGHRMQYLEWLEEQGDPRAEFLQLEPALVSLLDHCDYAYDLVDARVRLLRRHLDPAWVAVVGMLYRVDLCDVHPSALGVVARNIQAATDYSRDDCEQLVRNTPDTVETELAWAEAEALKAKLLVGSPRGFPHAQVKIYADHLAGKR